MNLSRPLLLLHRITFPLLFFSFFLHSTIPPLQYITVQDHGFNSRATTSVRVKLAPLFLLHVRHFSFFESARARNNFFPAS